VSNRKYEPVSPKPLGILGIHRHDLLVQQISQGSETNGCPGVTVTYLFHRVGGQPLCNIYGLIVEGRKK
jgi:hypothetical protein